MSHFPIENNPDVLNLYIKRLGVIKPKVQFVDVYGVSEDLLAIVPGPALAVLLVYPITKKSEVALLLLSEGHEREVWDLMKSDPIFFTKQKLVNTCGSVALLHALLNNYSDLGEVEENSILAELNGVVKHRLIRSDPEEIGTIVKNNKDLVAAHTETAFQGVTENQSIDTRINLHFTCFVWEWNHCVELDGRMDQPILHGACHSRSEFLRETARVIQKRMNIDVDLHSYSITALVPILS